jgi:hypothetical protein
VTKQHLADFVRQRIAIPLDIHVASFGCSSFHSPRTSASWAFTVVIPKVVPSFLLFLMIQNSTQERRRCTMAFSILPVAESVLLLVLLNQKVVPVPRTSPTSSLSFEAEAAVCPKVLQRQVCLLFFKHLDLTLSGSEFRHGTDANNSAHTSSVRKCFVC